MKVFKYRYCFNCKSIHKLLFIDGLKICLKTFNNIMKKYGFKKDSK